MNSPGNDADDEVKVPDMDKKEPVILDEVEWNERTQAMRNKLLRMNAVVENLIIKGRIKPAVLPMNGKTWIYFNVIPFIIKITGKTEIELKKYPAFHPIYGSTTEYSDFKGLFDLGDNGIEQIVTDMLAEFEAADKDTENMGEITLATSEN